MLPYQDSISAIRSWSPKIGALVLAILSISTAHYVGFMEDLPPQIAIVGGLNLASGVTVTFLFFVLASFVFARILSYYFLSLIYIVCSLYKIMRSFFVAQNFKDSRAMVGSYIKMLIYDNFWINVIRVMLFFVFMYQFYVRSLKNFPVSEIIIVFVITLGGVLARAGFLIMFPCGIYRRLKNSKRVKFRIRFGEQMILGLAALAVLFSYMAGQARMRHVASLDPVNFSSSDFSGIVRILISSGDLFLFSYTVGNSRHFVVFSKNEKIDVAESISDGAIFPN